jgi:NADPH-dependent 2,4-dienoyl-CoA reductase/sulfur reductase-like enzyme
MTRFFDRQIGRWGLGAVRWLMIGGLGPAWVCGAEREVDVVVYGGTAAGIAAAVQVKRMGRSVVVIEPSDRIGGLTTGGLGQTDIGNKAAIGGIAGVLAGGSALLRRSAGVEMAEAGGVQGQRADANGSGGTGDVDV